MQRTGSVLRLPRAVRHERTDGHRNMSLHSDLSRTQKAAALP